TFALVATEGRDLVTVNASEIQPALPDRLRTEAFEIAGRLQLRFDLGKHGADQFVVFGERADLDASRGISVDAMGRGVHRTASLPFRRHRSTRAPAVGIIRVALRLASHCTSPSGSLPDASGGSVGDANSG